MTCLTILPLGKKIEVKPGTILLDAIRQAGIEISSPCNGRQLCGKCKVGITGSAPPVDAPHEHLTAHEVAAGTRLACQVVIQSTMQVTLPEDYSMDTRILEGELIKKGRIAPAVQIRENNGQFQLAKSAIQTGVEMLLAAAGLDSDQLEKIVIAGAFGYHLRKGSLRQIGIVPRNFKGEIDFAGNTCRTGCALMLADATTRDLLQEKMKQVTHLAIAEAPDFQSRFIKNISLNGLI